MFGIRFACVIIVLFGINVIQNEVLAYETERSYEKNFTEHILYKLYVNENETLGLDEKDVRDMKHEMLNIPFSRVLKKIMMRLINVTKDSDKIDYMRREIYDVYQMVVHVENTCDELSKYRKINGPILVTKSLKELFREALDGKRGLNSKLQQSLGKIVLWKGRNLVDAIETHIEEFEPRCQSAKSRRQYFNEFFLSLLSYEIKGYANLDFVLEMKKDTINNYEKVKKDAYIEAKHRVNALTMTLEKVIRRASRQIWRCDPEKHKENKTFVELRNVFRRILYHEADFSDNPEKCYGVCPLFNKTVSPKCKRNECFLPQRYCKRVIDCREVTFKDSFDVCILKQNIEQEQKNYTGRRYNYVLPNEFSLNPFYNRDCDGHYRLIQTYTRGFIRPTICKSCNCICNEDDRSERYISLDSVTSDVDNGYVVTGVRFEKRNNTLYLKIQQGKLLPYVFIKNSSATWNDTIIDDNNVTRCITNRTKVEKKLKLEWFDRRGIMLDDLKLPKLSEIVTGVRFTTDRFADRNGTEYFVKLEIQSTPFDVKTGKMSPEYSYWYSSIVPLRQRTRLELEKYDIPTSLNTTNRLDGISHKYAYFTPSHLTSKDAGQTMLPLIDIQPVHANPAVPLTGISLDLKKGSGSGGYLTLKLNTLDMMDI